MRLKSHWPILVLAVAPSTAQVLPLGEEFQVNAYTTSEQLFPAVAGASDGGFLMVWDSDGSFGADQSGRSIQARRLAADGTFPQREVQLNVTAAGDQFFAKVAAGTGGTFLVTWATPGDQLLARTVDFDGKPLGDEFQVASDPAGYTVNATLTSDIDDGFLVAWNGQSQRSESGAGSRIMARRFDAFGAPRTDDFQINSYNVNLQWAAALASMEDGGFVVSWQSYGSEGSDSSGASIQARQFDAAGAALGPQFQVNTYTTGRQHASAVATLPGGGFVVSWISERGPGNYVWDVFARRYDSSGQPLGGEAQVNSETIHFGGTSFNRLAASPNGQLMAIWRGDLGAGGDRDSWSVQGRLLTAGDTQGPQFQVNTFTPGRQYRPDVAATPSGDFAVVWMSESSTAGDPAWGVFAQRYTATFFTDGFEAGDTSAWSLTVP